MADNDRTMFGSDYDSEADNDFSPSDEESDVYTSDLAGYSSEEWNNEFVDVQRNIREQLQLQECVDAAHSDYVNSDDEVLSPYDTDEEGDHIMNTNGGLIYDPRFPIEMIKFKKGMKFESPSEFRRVLKHNSISNGFNVEFLSSDERKVEAVCREECAWRICASWGQMGEAFVVKSLNNCHTCRRAPRSRCANYHWIANHFLERFRTNPNWEVVDMMEEIHEKFGISVSKQTCSMAREEARDMIKGSLNDHYHWLPSYVDELKMVNRSSTFEMVLERDTTESLNRFKRLYICFDALARGFIEGCRPVISLDGCSLKTKLKGQLLTAVGKDGNNAMFPIAWAVVEGENQASWTWFIELLRRNLAISSGDGWTIISDKQKGLENAVSHLLPHAQHRNCARHVYATWKKKGHSTEILKSIFWNAVKCTTRQDLQRTMGQMRAWKPQAAHDFEAVGLPKFCRAFISDSPKSEAIDNNISECFHSYILQFRYMPIIDMLEGIRTSLMQRIVKKRELFSGSNDELCPRVRKTIEENIKKSWECSLVHAGNHKFEVSSKGKRYVVDLHAGKCACRYWDIRGIPCCHAVACIQSLKKDPADFVDQCFKKDAYQRAYNDYIRPMNGKNLWNKPVDNHVFPPLEKTQPGRPRQRRRTDISERELNRPRSSREGAQTQRGVQAEGENSQVATQRTDIDVDEPVVDTYSQASEMIQRPSQSFPTPTPTDMDQSSLGAIKTMEQNKEVSGATETERKISPGASDEPSGMS